MYKMSSGMEMPLFINLECVRGVPVSLFSDREAEQLAFPFLFPDGINGYRPARDPSTSTLDYFQTRLLSSDPRWAAHVPYLFWSCNVMEQHRLQDNISVALRMRSSGGCAWQSPVVNRLTAGQLRDVSDNPENCYAFLHNMREPLRTGKEPILISLPCSEHWVLLLSSSLSVLMTWTGMIC